NVFVGTITFLRSTPIERSTISRAAVPLDTAIACSVPTERETIRSKRCVSGPRVSDPVWSDSSINSAIRWRSSVEDTGRAGGTGGSDPVIGTSSAMGHVRGLAQQHIEPHWAQVPVPKSLHD